MGRDQCRKWQVTINNPEKHSWNHDRIKLALSTIKGLDYWCMCDEVGNKEHTYHTHLFFYRKKSSFTFKQIKKLFPEAHIESALGTCVENRNYIRKEGKYENSNKTETNLKDTFEEMGECPIEEQGKRSDLEDLYDMIKDGMSNFEILETNANYMKHMDKLDKCRELLRYEEFKNKLRDIQAEYWFGDSGAGKTSGVFERYGGFDKVYRITNYRNPWDEYRGQDVIMFDDFRDYLLDIADLLRILDKYPLSLPCRYNNKQACFTKVYFTSNVPFDDLYADVQRFEKDTWKAFCRRFHCIKEFRNGSIVNYKSMDDYLHRYEDKDGFMKLSKAQQQEVDELYGMPPVKNNNPCCGCSMYDKNKGCEVLSIDKNFKCPRLQDKGLEVVKNE